MCFLKLIYYGKKNYDKLLYKIIFNVINLNVMIDLCEIYFICKFLLSPGKHKLY